MLGGKISLNFKKLFLGVGDFQAENRLDFVTSEVKI